jgi:hypothetical protein
VIPPSVRSHRAPRSDRSGATLGAGRYRLDLLTVSEGGVAEITEVAADTFAIENLGTTEVTVLIDGEEAVAPRAGETQQVSTWDFQGSRARSTTQADPYAGPVSLPDCV